MAKDPYADDIARLSTATRTHFTHFQVPKMPWHSEDHKFGETSGDRPDEPLDDGTVKPIGEPGVDESIDEFERAARDSILASTIFLVDAGRCYWCKSRAAYGYQGKLYCFECWSDDEETAAFQPFRGAD